MYRWQHQSTLLRTARIKKGLSQHHLDALLGSVKVRGQITSNLERARAGIPSRHIRKICEVLEIPVNDMISAMSQDHLEDLYRSVSVPEPVSDYVHTETLNMFPEMDVADAV